MCDATVEEMELVLKAQAEAKKLKSAAWDAKCKEMQAASERAVKAARTRRENARKRKLASAQQTDCDGFESDLDVELDEQENVNLYDDIDRD